MSKWDAQYKDGRCLRVIADDIREVVNQLYNPIEDIVSITKVKEYTCQVCGNIFENYKEFQEHEANCLGLTDVEYNTYINKKSWVGYCLIGYSNTFSNKDKEKYNKAVESLLEFERIHNIKLSEYKLIGE